MKKLIKKSKPNWAAVKKCFDGYFWTSKTSKKARKRMNFILDNVKASLIAKILPRNK